MKLGHGSALLKATCCKMLLWHGKKSAGCIKFWPGIGMENWTVFDMDLNGSLLNYIWNVNELEYAYWIWDVSWFEYLNFGIGLIINVLAYILQMIGICLT